MLRISLPLHPLLFRVLACVSFQATAAVNAAAAAAAAEQEVVARLTITSPPCAQASHLSRLRPRDNSTLCSYGTCAGTCLSQGAFCCNPGGISFPPDWICDNGSCITSVRGDTGVVDCYDPDNPSGTTQSCIDFKPTTTCFSTDRCYTCSSDEPFCHWQTWIASNSPTLRWFSCITDKEPDETFLAATITAAPSSTSSSASSSSTSTATTAPSPTSTSSLPTSTSPSTAPATSSTAAAAVTTSSSSSSVLTTGAIVGIAVGGAAIFILLAILLIYCFRRRRRSRAAAAEQQQQHQHQHQQQAASGTQISHQTSPVAELSTPLYYPNSLAGSGSQTGTAVADDQYWRYHSHPNLIVGGGGGGGGIIAEDRFKTRMPIELPGASPGASPGEAEREIDI